MKEKVNAFIKSRAFIIAIFVLLLAGLVAKIFYDSRIVGYFNANDSEFSYRNWHYTEQSFQFIEDKYLGVSDYDREKRFDFISVFRGSVYSVKGDSNYNYLYAYNGDYGYTYVKDGTVIPTSGTVTAVYCEGAHVYRNGFGVTEEQEDINMFQRIASLSGESVSFKTSHLAAAQREFYFAYNNCPVAAHQAGSIVYADGKFFFVKAGDSRNKQIPEEGEGKGIIITDSEILNFIKGNPILILPASYY